MQQFSDLCRDELGRGESENGTVPGQGFAIVISKLHVGYIEDQPIL